MAYTPKLTYKGRPLVRCGNDIYYGSMKDPFVVYLQVLSTKKENGVDVADKVHIVLLSTDESKPLPERIARQANKVGLYNALSFGDIMLHCNDPVKASRHSRIPGYDICHLHRYCYLHNCSHGRRHLAGSENGVYRRCNTISAADWRTDRIDRIRSCDRRCSLSAECRMGIWFYRAPCSAGNPYENGR